MYWILTLETHLTFKPTIPVLDWLADQEGQEGGAAVQEEERLRPGGWGAPRAGPG